jgi:hypothetical protein
MVFVKSFAVLALAAVPALAHFTLDFPLSRGFKYGVLSRRFLFNSYLDGNFNGTATTKSLSRYVVVSRTQAPAPCSL